MGNKIKVLHYISDFSLPSETFIYDLVKNLDDYGVNCFVLTHWLHMRDSRPFEKVKLTNESASIIKKAIYRFFNKWSIRNEKDILDFIFLFKPDVIHAHFGPNGVKIFKLIKKYNLDIKLIVSFHGTDVTMYPDKFKQYRNAIYDMHKSDVLCTFPSNFLKDEFQNKIKVNSTANQIVIPNGFNKLFREEFINERRVLSKKNQVVKLVSTGRLIPCKGFKSLIKAFSILNEEKPNIHLTIVGGGSQERELLNLINNKNLQHKITLTGMVSHESVKEIVSGCDIYIQPSIVDVKTGQTESFGIATLEAIALGLPVIITNVGGLPDTVLGGDNQFAKIVEPNSPEEMSSAIKDMMYLTGSNHIFREKVMSFYSQDKQCDSFLNIYN